MKKIDTGGVTVRARKKEVIKRISLHSSVFWETSLLLWLYSQTYSTLEFIVSNFYTIEVLYNEWQQCRVPQSLGSPQFMTTRASGFWSLHFTMMSVSKVRIPPEKPRELSSNLDATLTPGDPPWAPCVFIFAWYPRCELGLPHTGR